MIFSQLPHMRRRRLPVPRLVYIPLNMSICMRTFTHACRTCESSVSTKECFTCLKMRPDLRWSTMSFSQLPHMRRRRSPVPRLVYIPLNMPISMRTFRHACRSSESSVSTKECFTCLKMCPGLRWSTMIFSQLPHMRRRRLPVPRLVYIPLNMSICMRTFTHTSRSCESSVSTKECFTCLKMRPDLRWPTMSFSQLPHMRRRRSPVPRLVYIPLNMSICMRTFTQACRSCESSVSTKECFTCLKMPPELRWSTIIFSQLPHMRTSIAPVPRLVYIPLNMSICMRTFRHKCRSCESSVSTKGCFTCLKMRPELRWSTMILREHSVKAVRPVYVHLYDTLHAVKYQSIYTNKVTKILVVKTFIE